MEKYKSAIKIIVEPLVMYQKSVYGLSSDTYFFNDISSHPIEKSIAKVGA
jgi:hypothetical protein